MPHREDRLMTLLAFGSAPCAMNIKYFRVTARMQGVVFTAIFGKRDDLVGTNLDDEVTDLDSDRAMGKWRLHWSGDDIKSTERRTTTDV